MNKLISISPQRLPKSTTKGNGKNEMLYIKQLTLILNLQTDSYALPISLLILTKQRKKKKRLFCSLMCLILCPDTFFMYAN